MLTASRLQLHDFVMAVVDDARGTEKHNPIDQYIYQFFEDVCVFEA